MDFVKRHMFFILCGVGAAAGVALGITGMQGMPEVMKEMQGVEGVYRSLNGLGSNAVGRVRLDAEQKRIDTISEDHKDVFGRVEKLYGLAPLLDGVFPAGNPVSRTEFQRQYKIAMDELLGKLKMGTVPSNRDIGLWRSRIADEVAAREQEGGAASFDDGVTKTSAGVLTAAGVRGDANSRAAIAKAQSLFCYGVGFDTNPATTVQSLWFEPNLRDSDTVDAPDLWTVWHAQLGYWIQRDVVNAIAAVNNEAAEQLRDSGAYAWVGNMPVKEIVSIRLSDGYVAQTGDEFFGGQPGGSEPATPPGTPVTVFTGSASNDWYEVVQFAVKLVMDQRDIPALLDELSKNRFYTVLRVSYEAVPFDRKMRGKVYGSEPTVSVVMDCELVMIGDVFRKWMPQEVCEHYEVSCPPPPSDGDGE